MRRLKRLLSFCLLPLLAAGLFSFGWAQPADAARVVRILRDAGYQGFLTLEYEAAEDPFEAVPRHLDELREACGPLLS